MNSQQYATSDNSIVINTEQIRGFESSIGLTFTIIPNNEKPIFPSIDSPIYACIYFFLNGETIYIWQLITITEISKNIIIPLEGVYYPYTESFTEDNLPISDVSAIIYYSID